ncbi:MAG: lipopolysaccharide kinase InaA family protein [Gemmatimonadota bacterium]
MSNADTLSPFAGSPIGTRGGLIPEGMFPSGYARKAIGNATVVAHGSVLPYFEEMLYRHPTLYAWAASQTRKRPMQGRTVAWAVPLPDSEVTVVVRHSTHGGLLAPVTKDVFRNPRAADELRRSWTMRHVGIPTPRILGYAQYPLLGGQFSRADVITREVPDSADLARVLTTDDARFPHEACINATLTLLHRLARTWAYHPDLNLKNILLTPYQGGEPTAYALDVDVLRFAEKNAEWMNVARLMRSARKHLETSGAPGIAALIERLGG